MSDRAVEPWRTIVAVALSSLLVACATLTLREPPRVDIASVALDRVEGSDAWFTVEVVLTNRVDRDLTIQGLNGALAIEGESIAQATLVDGPVRLPANGTANARMSAHTGMDAILRAVAAAMRRGATLMAPGARPVLHYTLDGSATIEGGLRVPFRREGELGEGAK
ncbi:MAG TPA: LEA type 2 family protein [Casimicrobiaceae bacterium]|nr:LEA type 2 family protein [Casimicrobiaceae bacterium]